MSRDPRMEFDLRPLWPRNFMNKVFEPFFSGPIDQEDRMILYFLRVFPSNTGDTVGMTITPE